MAELISNEAEAGSSSQMRPSLHAALHVVERHTGLTDEAQALTALRTVAEGLVQRLTAAEATDLIAQLPSALHAPLLEAPAGPNKQLTAERIRDMLGERLAMQPTQAATLLPAVAQALRDLVSPGEMQDLLAQLPRDLRELLEAPAGA
jgi:uncharacterized protein (DUF2267 family)